MQGVGLLAAISLAMMCMVWLAFPYSSQAVAGGDETPLPVITAQSTPDPADPVILERLEKPEIPDVPLLADKGSITYWSVCMACHGDWGQGLTDEWRSAGFGADMNCWQSKCHASNHPPQGFDFPRIVPPVVGSATLRSFLTADELHQYLLEKMPWWNPGSLSDDEAWELTAFLLRENGQLAEGVEFNIQEASVAPVHLPIRSQAAEQKGQWILLAVLSLASVAVIAVNSSKMRELLPTTGEGRARPNFMHHLHPPSIPMLQARWRYTLGAGGLAVFLFLVLGITGTLEMFFYIPTPEQAGVSVQTITYLTPFGGLIRGIHFWAAQALVVVVVIHLLRVVFTGSFALPRRFNYFIGVALLVLTLFMDFTGYVLRWDEGIRWALMVGTNLLQTIPWVGDRIYGFVIGGPQPGAATLIRFYAWHIFGLTLIMIVFIVWHIFRMRRDGGISAPPPELRTDTRRIARYELVQREALAALLVLVVLILLGSLAPAPLAVPIQDTNLQLFKDVRAPWFFLWIQQLLRYGDAFWMGVMIPLGVVAVLILVPYITPRLPEGQKGRWLPRAGRLVQVIVGSIAVLWLVLTVLELLN